MRAPAPFSFRAPHASSLEANLRHQELQQLQKLHEREGLLRAPAPAPAQVSTVLVGGLLCVLGAAVLGVALYASATRLEPAIAAAVPLLGHVDNLVEHANAAAEGARPHVAAASAMLNRTGRLVERLERLAAHPIMKVSLGDLATR
jgi:hypothetical protein